MLFRLAQPHADFPSLLVSYMAHIIPEGSGDTIGETGIGTGPFKLVSFDAEGTTVLAANDDYWRGAPELAGIELIAIADSVARTSAVPAGQIDVLLNTPSAQAALFADNPGFETITFPTGEWSGLVMRTDTPPFDDVRVRKAMRLLADRQAFVDLVLEGQGTVVCDTPVAKRDVYHWETACPQDLEQARALLAEAGYADGLNVTIYTASTFPEFIPLAEVYQQQAAAVGITVDIEVVPPDNFWSDVWLTEAFYPIAWRERPADLILNLVWRSTADWNESYYIQSSAIGRRFRGPYPGGCGVGRSALGAGLRRRHHQHHVWLESLDQRPAGAAKFPHGCHAPQHFDQGRAFSRVADRDRHGGLRQDRHADLGAAARHPHSSLCRRRCA